MLKLYLYIEFYTNFIAPSCCPLVTMIWLQACVLTCVVVYGVLAQESHFSGVIEETRECYSGCGAEEPRERWECRTKCNEEMARRTTELSEEDPEEGVEPVRKCDASCPNGGFPDGEEESVPFNDGFGVEPEGQEGQEGRVEL